MKILLVFSNPSSTPRLAQAAELRKLRRDCRSYEYKDQIELIDRHAVTVEDFTDALTSLRPEVVHFSGHGTSNAIYFCDENNQDVEVTPDRLEAILKGKGVKAVYLSACYSDAFAQAISRSIDCVIGSSSCLDDAHAIKIASTFYSGIGADDSAAVAFQCALDMAIAKGIGDQGLGIRGDFIPSLANARKVARAELKEGAKIRTAVAGVLVAGLSLSLQPFNRYLFSEPWQSVWLLALLAAMAGLLWVWRVSWLPLLNYRFWAFLVVYSLFFTVASSSNIMEFKRTLAGVSESDIPSDPLGLAWIGDWRYQLFPVSEKPSVPITVVTLSDNVAAVKRRSEILEVLSWSASNEARLVALDFVFLSEIPAFDTQICAVVEGLRESGTPVIGAYGFERLDGDYGEDYAPQRYVPSIGRCFESGNLGHAVAYLGSGRKIRGIPTLFNNDVARPSFSYVVAKQAVNEAEIGAAKSFPQFFQFLPPGKPVLAVSYSDLLASDLSQRISDKVVIVGGGEKDMYSTPLHDQPVSGALLHAYAVHSYVTDTKITYASPFFASVFVFGGCAMLCLLAANSATRKVLYTASAMAAAVIIIVSLAAALLGRVILPIAYPILAMALLLPLLPYMTRWVGRVDSIQT